MPTPRMRASKWLTTFVALNLSRLHFAWGTPSPCPWDLTLLRQNGRSGHNNSRARTPSGTRVDAPVASLRCRIPRSGIRAYQNASRQMNPSAQFTRSIVQYYGSEFVNYTVATLLEKLRIEQTKSRPRRSNDNGLVEAKNGAVVRKHMGYGHIGSAHAEAIHSFYEKHFNGYLNYHRPSGQAEIIEGEKGKSRRVYRWYATPWEVLRQLPGVAGYLKPELTIDALNAVAKVETDTEAARRMQGAKQKLFASFRQKRGA